VSEPEPSQDAEATTEADPQGDSQAEAATKPRRRRHVWLAAYAVLTIGVSIVLLVLVQRWLPIGTISGRAIGNVKSVELSDVARHVHRPAELGEGGTYAVKLPPFAREPRIVIIGTRGERVDSAILPMTRGPSTAPTYALWYTPLDVAVDAGRVRFNWGAIPEGEGYPRSRRYSLLLRYQKKDGERGEISFLAMTPGRTTEVGEVHGLLQEWDGKQNVVLELRAYDPGEKDGAQWTAIERPWTVPPAPQSPPPGGSAPKRDR
jgi:hypothetical protein